MNAILEHMAGDVLFVALQVRSFLYFYYCHSLLTLREQGSQMLTIALPV
jgi:hypothetical protein